MTIAGASERIPGLFYDKGGMVFNVKHPDYGAVGDGVTVDTAAVQAAVTACIAAGGGIVYLPPGTYLLGTITITGSRVVFCGAGDSTVINFVPGNPNASPPGDRGILVHDDTKISGVIPSVSGALAIGATSITVTSAADVADLVANQWIRLQEIDSGHGDAVVVDWAQVSSVAGTTVHLVQPLRTAFPGTRLGTKIQKIITPIEHVIVRDFRWVSTDNSQNNVGVQIGFPCKDCLVQNVTVVDADGNAFYAWRAKGVTFRDCKQEGNRGQASEFASTVDLLIDGCKFANEGYVANTAGFTLDFGTAFFRVVNNDVINSHNLAMQVLYGVHDGVIGFNHIGYITADANAQGIILKGTQRVTVIGNTLVGGYAAENGINTGHDTVASPTLAASGNTVMGNRVNGFTAPFGGDSGSGFFLNPEPDVLAAAWLLMADFSTSSALVMQDLGGVEHTLFVGAGASIAGGFGIYDKTSEKIVAGIHNTGIVTFPQGPIAGAAVVTLTDAGTVAVDASLSNAYKVTITAARAIGAPTNPTSGQRIVITVIQDGTGGWALTWNAVFKVSWSDTGNTAGKRSSIAFVYDGTNWNQDGAQTPYV